MTTRDPIIDDYIANAAPSFRPILEHIRIAFHAGYAEIEENIKWGLPSFEANGIVGGMAAFKRHATYGFWRSDEIDDPAGILTRDISASFMAQRFTDIDQLPSIEVLADYVKRAVDLNLSGKPKSRSLRRDKKKLELIVPEDLRDLLMRHSNAKKVFDDFAPGHRRDYVEWITGAKREDTRQRRLATTLAQLLEGKTRNWKYEKKKMP